MKKLFCCTSEPAASLSEPVETLHAATQTTPGQRGGGGERGSRSMKVVPRDPGNTTNDRMIDG